MEDWELLSILFGSGTREKGVYDLSKDLLHSLGGLERILGVGSTHFPKIAGLGPAKKAILLSLAEIIRRVRKKSLMDSHFSFPFLQIYETLSLLSFQETRETFYLASFRLSGQLARLEVLARGSLTEVGVHKRDIAKILLDDSAGFCLVSHNHPGHSAYPSEQDRFLYRELSDFLDELEILCLDQWILGDDGLYSCRSEGFLNTDLWQMDSLPLEYGFLKEYSCRQ